MSEVAATTPNAPAPASPNTNSTPKSSSNDGPARMSIKDYAKNLGRAPAPESDEVPVETAEAADPAEFEAPDETVEEEVVEEEVVEEEEDLSWLDGVKPYKELHGLPLTEVLQALAEGRLPDQLLNVLKVKMKDGDREWEDTIEKARVGAMLRQDYTKKRQAEAAEKAAWMSEKNDILSIHHGWKEDKTGKALAAGLQRMGYPFLEAAKILAEDHRKLAAMSPEARELYLEKQRVQNELEQFKYEQQKAQRSQTEAEHKAQVDKNISFVEQNGRSLFAQAQVPLNKRTWNMFLVNFKAEMEANPGQPWTEDMVRGAFEEVRAEYEALKKEVGAPAQPPAKKPQVATTQKPPTSPGRQQLAAAGLGTTKVDSGKPAKVRTPNNGKMSIKDFAKRFGA